MSYRWMGIDPSLTNTGIVVVRNGKAIGNLLATTRPDKEREHDDQQRIDFIAKEVMARCEHFRPTMVGIENHAFGIQHGDTRPHEVAGVIKLELWRAGIPFVVKGISEVKKFATGNGRASKEQMVAAALAEGFKQGKNHNLADAYFVAKLTELDHA